MTMPLELNVMVLPFFSSLMTSCSLPLVSSSWMTCPLLVRIDLLVERRRAAGLRRRLASTAFGGAPSGYQTPVQMG